MKVLRWVAPERSVAFFFASASVLAAACGGQRTTTSGAAGAGGTRQAANGGGVAVAVGAVPGNVGGAGGAVALAGTSGNTAGSPNSGVQGGGGAGSGTASGGRPDVDEPGWPTNALDPRTETLPGGTVQRGWSQLDLGKNANFDGGDEASPTSCPDPDAMLTPGTVQFENGTWTLTGSGEGFMHGWDQGNLVYFTTKIRGDFTFAAKVEGLEMTNGAQLDGAAEALLNVREDLGYKQPTHSIIAGAAPGKYLFMARYSWEGENGKWWHWPAWPETWPAHRDVQSWTRLVARGDAIAAETSTDGKSWQPIEDADQNQQHPIWYPFRLEALAHDRYVALACSARNDRNYAPKVTPPGKTSSCFDPSSEQLRAAARCVFSHVTLTQP